MACVGDPVLHPPWSWSCLWQPLWAQALSVPSPAPAVVACGPWVRVCAVQSAWQPVAPAVLLLSEAPHLTCAWQVGIGNPPFHGTPQPPTSWLWAPLPQGYLGPKGWCDARPPSFLPHLPAGLCAPRPPHPRGPCSLVTHPLPFTTISFRQPVIAS